MTEALILAGDVGGTKTNLAVFTSELERPPLAQASFVSREHAGLEEMAAKFLSGAGLKAQRAAFGVAGPVFAGRAQITKLSWGVDARAIKTALGLEAVTVVNDLVATAGGIEALDDADLLNLNPAARPEERGSRAVIAPGTGLGEAMMFWEGDGYRAQATEGGHALFSPASREQLALAEFLFPARGAVSFDLLASGRGLPLLYEFIKETGGFPRSFWLDEAGGDALASAITQAALGLANPLCLATLKLFVEILAVEARNLALKSLSTGGVFVGGGIPPRMPQIFRDAFRAAFVGSSGPMRELLAAMPVWLILNPYTALLGAARLARESS